MPAFMALGKEGGSGGLWGCSSLSGVAWVDPACSEAAVERSVSLDCGCGAVATFAGSQLPLAGGRFVGEVQRHGIR